MTGRWSLFVCLMIESLWGVVRDVTAALLLVFIRRWYEVDCLPVAVRSTFRFAVRSSLLFRLVGAVQYWTGPLCNRSAVVLLGCWHMCFQNFDSTISINVVRIKYHWGNCLINVTSSQIGSSVGVLQKSEMTQILLFIKTKGHLLSVSSK